jgi:hypothetical protein
MSLRALRHARPARFARVVCTVLAVGAVSCQSKSSSAPAAAVSPSTPLALSTSDPASAPSDVVETIYDGGLKTWADWGWAKREVSGPGPAKVNFSGWGGWILANQGLTTMRFGSLVFRMKARETDGDFLTVHLVGPGGDVAEVTVGPEHRSHLTGANAGWDRVEIPFAQLDPDSVPFDRVVFRAQRSTTDEWTLIDAIGLTRAKPGDDAIHAGAAPPASALAGTSRRTLPIRISCGARATKISPLIYGIAYSHMDDTKEHQWHMGATIRRWGGNNMSRYNWQIHALNLDSDWFYENHTVPPYTTFLAEDAAHGVSSALTIPMIGWVAKDASSVGFPVSAYGPQARTDPSNQEAGNGQTKDGKDIRPGPATRTSIAATPEWVSQWVAAIRAEDARSRRRSVQQYILDNEPALWNHTHRDVRPEPLTYDELVQRTIDYGSAVRRADPDAVIAGPAEWGWVNYIYSAKDAENNYAKVDRRAHGDVPLIEFYLRKLHEYEQRSGTRVLDVVDLHFYPAFEDGTPRTEDAKDPLRLRSTRSLWDPDYVDESWIHEKIRLLPRLKEWIAANYPGRGISIGEWNFGGETRMSGALATAEALGRFAQYGVTSAFYWTFPPPGSPTMLAFATYRNFDGKGGHFLDWMLPAGPPVEGLVSAFTSRDEEGKHLVTILVNQSPDVLVDAQVDLSSSGALASRQSYTLARGMRAIAAGPVTSDASPSFTQSLPPYSITVLDIHLAAPLAGGLTN